MSFIDSFLKEHGIPYTVKRDGCKDRQEIGLENRDEANRPYICFFPDKDIRAGDSLINPHGDTFYVTEAKMRYMKAEASYLQAYFQTAAERERETNANSVVFNIGTAYGSVIGNSNQATINYKTSLDEIKARVEQEPSEDKEDLKKIISLLELVVNDNVPPSKGLFSKFSAVMERHSWIANAAASAILSWLTTQIG